MVASHKCLFIHYQKDGMDNHTYHRKFLAHVETIKTYRGVGAVRVVPTFLANNIKELADSGTILDAKNPTYAKHALAVSAVHEEYLAALMLSGAHQEGFCDLWINLKNQDSYGDDCCLKTLNAYLSVLNRWTPATTKSLRGPPCTPSITEQVKDKDKALVSAQDTKKM
jgi:hypothetical protein